MFGRRFGGDRDLLRPAPIVDDEAEPVFVVGSVRSGTSIMHRALREGADLPGFHEGNVGSLMQRMLDEIAVQFEHISDEILARKDNQMLARLDREALENHVVNWFVEFYRSQRSGRWLDKTPESYRNAPMVRACERFLRAFPRARFVYCVRRGIEQIMSVRRKFPQLPFEFSCLAWAESVENWIEVRDRLGDSWVEARQHELALQPERVATELAALLDLTKEQCRRVASIFAHTRQEQTHFAEDFRSTGLAETPWSDDDRAMFERICGRAMDAMGYSLESSLLDPAAPLRLFVPIEHASGAVKRSNVAPEEWGFCRSGSDGVQLHPGPRGGPPAEVRYLAAPCSGQDTFGARVEVPDDWSDAIVFTVRIEASDGSVVAAHEVEVDGAGSADVLLEFAPLHGPHDVVIATRMAEGGRSQPSAAVWRDAGLRIGER